jgi:hypothetical protein
MPPKKKSAKLAKAVASKSPKFPKTTLEKALQIPFAIKDKNGGNPWEPEEIRQAVAVSQGNSWYSQTAASRDYGLTSGTRDAPPISLTELGREIVYAPNPETELALKKQAFLNIDIFKRVLEYYKGSNLPDMKYLGNVLTKQFGLDPETHEEFAKIFRENCQYLGITSGVPQAPLQKGKSHWNPARGQSRSQRVPQAQSLRRLSSFHSSSEMRNIQRDSSSKSFVA